MMQKELVQTITLLWRLLNYRTNLEEYIGYQECSLTLCDKCC